MKVFKSDERGFVAAEIAVSLPLVIFLLYSLATLTIKAVQISRAQIADYVLETEIRDVLERMTAEAKAAKSVEFTKTQINFVYHTDLINNTDAALSDLNDKRIYIFESSGTKNIYSKRRTNNVTTPITGGNYFGDTEVLETDYSSPATNLLRIKIKMKSKVTGREMTMTTAVFMPGCEVVRDRK